MKTSIDALVEFRRTCAAMMSAALALLTALEVEAFKVGGPTQLTPARKDDIRLIQKIVADHYGLSTGIMTSRDKSNDAAQPRQVAMVLCRELTQHRLIVIAKAFARDHGTVLHSLKAVAARAELDAVFAGELDVMRKRARVVLLPLNTSQQGEAARA